MKVSLLVGVCVFGHSVKVLGGGTQLLEACRTGDLSVIELEHARGTNLDEAFQPTRGRTLVTPLVFAVNNRQYEVVQCLLGMGANPDDAPCYHSTPLNRACKDGDPRMVSIILDGGADTNKEDRPILGSGFPIEFAAGGPGSKKNVYEIHRVAIVNALLEKGARVPLYEQGDGSRRPKEQVEKFFKKHNLEATNVVKI